jgi:hypothetical protein
MAHYSNQNSGATVSSPTDRALEHGWIHDLVRGEMHPEADRLLQGANGGIDPQRQIEEATIEFLTDLRDEFSEYARVFNGYSEAGVRFQEAKVYSVAQTAADFMVYRNQVKLVISNASHGVIQIQFAQHHRMTQPGVNGGSGQGQSQPQVQELLAQIGPFGDVSWTYQGEKVAAHQVARYYFAEFVRATREAKRSRSGSQQVLLDQIKALLQEQGLNL